MMCQTPHNKKYYVNQRSLFLKTVGTPSLAIVSVVFAKSVRKKIEGTTCSQIFNLLLSGFLHSARCEPQINYLIDLL